MNMKRIRQHIALVLTLLLLGGITTESWAYKVTYHILTKPIDNDIYHLKDAFSGKRLEAVRVVDNSATTIGLPDAYKSPLAENFAYYASTDVTKSASAEEMYDYSGTNKSYYYTINGGATDIKGNTVSANMDVYVIYDYKTDNGIADLSGMKEYNLTMSGGFLGFNRGRNNRIAVIPESSGRVSAEALASEDFVEVNTSGIAGTNITNFWSGNKNPKAYVGGQFHFIFKFEGSDPYNILIRTAYNKNYTYIEQHGSESSLYYKYYKDSYLFWPSSEGAGFFLSSDAHKKYTQVSTGYRSDEMPSITSEATTGYFKSKGSDVTYNSFALLNNTNSDGYVFLISRYVNKEGNISDPAHYSSAKYNFLTRDGNYNNLKSESKTLADASKNYSTDQKIYQINNYVFKVYRKCSTEATEEDKVLKSYVRTSEYFASDNLVDLVPDELKRKYVNFTGAYKENTFDTPFATLADVDANATTEDYGGKTYKVIWLKYETDMPFETWTQENSDSDGDAAVDYNELTWYNFYTNKDTQYITYLATGVFNTNSNHSRYTRDSHFAFVGDPYEMRIISRKATDDNSGTLQYLKFASTFTDNMTYDGTGTKWETIYDDNSGDYADCFRLKKYQTDGQYLGWNYGTGNYPLIGSATDATRLTVVELPKLTYTYHIINTSGTEAVKATVEQNISTRLDYNAIPEIIRSPALRAATLTFTTYDSDAMTDHTTAITETNDDSDSSYKNHIFVSYTGQANYSGDYNVRLNGEYIYYDGGTIKSQAEINDTEAGTNSYKWTLNASDPYAMTIKNLGSTQFVKVDSWTDGAAIKWDTEANASKFIVKSSTFTGVYEVMAATGSSVDASTTYYNIGRNGTDVRVYSNAAYVHGYNQLRFLLTATTAQNVTYHLIDKAGTDLLQVVARQSTGDAPMFPTDYRSPLVAQYHYWTTMSHNVSVAHISDATDQDSDGIVDVYVTYDTDATYDLQNKKTMYLLKYEMGTPFRAENGSDGLESSPITPVYPYCNGDCNFFVYGQEQYDIQQQSAASTRTRWAWFLESPNNDPYHVKICSRQIETYNGDENRAYFHTYAETYGGSKHVITGLSWPGISGVQGTEYMVLGTTGQFRLLTTDAIAVDQNDDGDTDEEGESNVRHTVNSFEQYWKTWDTVRKKVLGDGSAVARQSDPNTVPATPAAPTAAAASTDNRTYLTDVMEWHSYEQWAYAKRWNGYNISGATSKGWEEIEHWFQTVTMGEGYFDLIPATIDPALILLDQHGWEIMRKPLPSSANDPELEAKHAALRVYDSPLVKEYHFWTKTSKRTGFHQYYNLSQRVSVNGTNYTSTSLGSLPPIDATNVKDAKGNILDQYVTYVVKDEYVQSLGEPFLIQQGSKYVSYNGSELSTSDVPTPGGMSKYIIDNITNLTTNGSKNTDLWYLKPNANIDIEMGYGDAGHDWTNDYTVTDFSESGFDPYNIQMSSVNTSTMYFKTNATGATLSEGILEGTYSATPAVAMDSDDADGVSCTWYDSRRLSITNKTFMAVQDESGNMMLMPRFDHTARMKNFSTLVAPTDPGIADAHTTLYRPLVYNYLIIDNNGSEALRYKGGGDLVPQIPDQFKSPLAKDFTFWTEAAATNQITESLAGAGLTTEGGSGNDVYVRYSYDEDADVLGILKGKWLTMKLNNRDMRYTNSDIYYDLAVGKKENSVYSQSIAAESKPATVDGDDQKWQWKFVADNFTDPDPYNINLYNRAKTDGAVLTQGGALLSHGSGGYLLAKKDGDYTYKCLKGKDIKTHESTDYAENAAAYSSEDIGSASYEDVKGQILLFDDVTHTYTYKIYTNGSNGSNEVKYGVEAVSATQAHSDAAENDFVPVLPEEIRSPLLNADQFLYYGAETDMGNSAREIENLYGLYDDIVYVRYTAYDEKTTEYKVPNVKDVVDSKVARGEASNDASLDISGNLIYNIIWYDDNMMQSTDGSAISGLADQDMQGGDAFVWQFEGDDPYAIKIKHKNSNNYAVGSSTLAGTATSTFMLLPSSEWQYGVLQVTGDSNGRKLTTVGNALTADASTTPTRFIIFGLSTNKVIYHLVIANIGGYVDIPYSEKETNGSWKSGYSPSDNKTKRINGSSWRDLTTAASGVAGDKYQLGETKSINSTNVTYCVDQGHITLGDSLKVPEALLRPNCKYFFYVDGIYNSDACTEANASLNNLYKGLQLKYMGTEADLVGKTVVINIEYQFDDGLPTNSGSHFVTNSAGTEWYTFETNDATPYLANFTYKDNKLKGIEGRIGHYTNEFLWSPVGDPYGFKMYNRYVYKNGTEDGHLTKVMTTTLTPAADADLIMAVDSDPDKPVYELLAGTTEGNFKVQTLTEKNGTPLYLDNSSGTVKLKASTTTEWHFGLDQSLFDPYYLRAGNVGGLNESGVTAYEAATNLMEKQAVVYNPANIVNFSPGYYRIFNQPNSLGINVPRYLSGYTHKTELTAAIPMHFYEREGVTTTFDVLGSGFTSTAATRGQIPIVAPEYDPASIFYITGSEPYTMQTQGLYVKENKMTDNSAQATSFEVIDIGGAVVLLRDQSDPKKYLHYKQNTNIYDVKFETHATFGDDDASKWCMEPANKKGLWIETHSGGEEAVLSTLWYYSSYCVPFDLLIQSKNEDDGDGVGKHSSNAYTCVAEWEDEPESPWTTTMLHPKSIGKYNTGTYADNDYFVPAGTPVLFSTKRATSYIKATIPTTTPSTPITTIFSAKYLEQLLTGWDNDKRVYVFGPKMEGTITLNTSDGTISAVLPSLGNTNVGFHINANPNKEAGLTKASWTRNNYYVLHNRIYYKSDTSGASARDMDAPQFVPVIFGDEENEEESEELQPDGSRVTVSGDGKVYDLSGRCVANEQQVKDGSWWSQAARGVYILNGKKIVKR